MELKLIGRSSSHFTRVVRMVALELGVEYTFIPLADLSSRDPSHYAHNPALRIPVLETPDGPWFGALNACRELARRTRGAPTIVWPEELHDRNAANAQELVLQGMSTEVALIMQAEGGAVATTGKAFESLANSLRWLDGHLPDIRACSSQREALSILGLTMYCFVSHLAFRKVTDLTPYPALRAFCAEYGRRPAAQATTYRYDLSS